jgi:hypothetical protein
LAPRELALPLHSLPPILDNASQTPTSSCSKGSRGLSVQPRVLGIFTETTVSPGPSKRQRPSRYAIRAGRNLPDKEFRSSLTRSITERNRTSFTMRLPACRHADGTISSSTPLRMSGVWSLRILARTSEPFLLIVRTRRIFTAALGAASSAGYSEFPAYGQMRTVPLPARGAANLP